MSITMSNQETDRSDVQCRAEHSEGDEDELAEFNKTLTTNFDLLPLFERQYNTFIRTRLYSMRTNEKLSSRWRDRVLGKDVVTGQRTMPIVSDYHFQNCRTKLMASLSPGNYQTFRKHLVPGPGVDKFGQRPIPADMMLRKTENPSPPCRKSKKRAKEQTIAA